jgi:methionyl-tRNA synthetase
LEAVWNFVARCNAYVEESAPWKMAKDEALAQELDGVLYRLSESLRIIAILISPVLPEASRQILLQLNVTGEVTLKDAAWGGLPDGHQLGEPVPVFPRIEAPAADAEK